MPIDTVDFQPETAVDFQPDTGVDFQVEETPSSLQPVTAPPRQPAASLPPQEQQRQAAFGIEPAPELKDLTFDEFKQLAGEMLTTGLIKTPKFTIKPEDSFLVSAGKSVFNEIASVPEFMSSPLGAGTMAAGGAGTVRVGKALIPASRIVATAFAADTYYNLRKNLIETMPHLLKMSESELGEFVGRTAASGLLLGGLIRGAVGKAGAPVKAEAPVEQAAKQAEAAGLPATAEALREPAPVEKVAEPTALTPVELGTTPEPQIGPGLSPMPEPVFGPPATPARGEGGGPPPTRVESGAPVEPTTPVVTGAPAEGPAGPAIRPTTTEVAPSQAEAKPIVPARIIAAAYKTPSGRIITGLQGLEMQGVTHMEADAAAREQGLQVDESMAGFIDNTGRFYDREQAYQAFGAQIDASLDTFDKGKLHTGKMVPVEDEAKSQAEAKPAAPAAEPTEVTSASEIEGPVGVVGRPRTGVAPQVAEGGPAEVQPAPGAEGAAGAPLQGGERASVVAGGAQGEVRGEVEAKPAEPASAEPMVGMGAAVPAEFERGQGSPTAMKFRMIDAERQKRGLAPLVKPESVADQAVLDRAVAALDRDPSLPDRLVAELNEKPRPIEDWENHVLLLRKIELRQELDRAARDAAQAYEDGRVDDMESAKSRWDSWSDRLTQLEQASRVAGTERGRALRALQVMVNEDFSLAEMETRLRMAKGGSPLTDAERVKLVQIADEYKAAAEKAEERAKTAEQRFLEQETARVLAEAKLRTLETGAPKYPPPVIRAAERIVSSMERTADRYMKELMGATWAPGPEQMAKLAFISATRLARLGLDFTKWSAEMVKDFGDKIKPYLDDLYKRGQALLDQHLEEQTKPMAQPVREKVKKAVKKEGERDAVHDLTDKIRAKVEKDEVAQITPLVQKLARELVAAGTTDRNALIDQLHAILKTVIPDITRRQTMEAMSGYGDFKPLTKDDVSVQLRDLKGQVQQVLKLEDIQAKQPLPKTGIERRVPSNEERRLIKQVNEAKKKFGVVVTDPERQLKSALDARKTAMRNRIADLEYEIRTRQRIVKDRTAPPTDPELEGLIAERDRLKAEHEAIFRKPGLTDVQRLRLALAAAQRAEGYWQEKLANAKKGVFGPVAKLKAALSSPELDALRSRTEALRAEVEALEELANPKATPDQISLKALKSRMRSEEAKLLERMAKSDFARRKPRQVPLDPEAIGQRARLQKLRVEFGRMQFQAEQALRSRARRGLDAAMNTIDAARALKTSFDLSYFFRQGAPFVAGHPIRAFRAFLKTIRAVRSEQDMLEINEEIMERPNFKSGLYHQSKLYLADQYGRLGSMEEAYMSHWAHRIPGVAASERAYITFLNRLRADMFDLIYDSVRNPDLSAAEKGRIVAHLVNAFTGRGELSQNAAVGLNRLFFSPRLVISRFQVLTGEPFWRARGARMAVAKEYARSLAGIAAIYTLAHMAGLQVGFNPFSSDFGKIIIGDTRIDPLAGLSQALVFLARSGLGTMTSIRGKTKPLRGPGMKYGDMDINDVIWNFIRSKLAPTPGGIVDLASRKEPGTGRPLTKTEIALNWIMPMSFDDMYSVMRAHNMPTGMALSLLLMLGMGVRNYGSEPSLTQDAAEALGAPVQPARR